jgi:hypothetical protein
MRGESTQFLRPDVRLRLKLDFALMILRVRARRGDFSFGHLHEPVQVSSQYEPEAQEHQCWPEGSFQLLLRRRRDSGNSRRAA